MRTLFCCVAAASLVTAAGCGTSAPGPVRLEGGGSSFVGPMMKKWAGEYQKSRGIEVDYSATASGDGIAQMTDKKNLFGCTDAPMNEEQLKAAAKKGGNVLHIPLVMGGVVPIYNLPEVESPLRFSGPVLADIFLGKIRKWNEEALAKLNPGVTLPELEITIAHRSDASGTSYIFTDYLSKVSPEWKEKVGATTEPKWPTGAGAPKNAGVAGLVAGTKGALGYVELIYARDNKNLKYGAVQNKEGNFITASLESVTAAAAGLKDVPDDLRYSLTEPDGADAYPICGTTWMVVYEHQPADKVKPLTDFIRWATHDGQRYTKELHYASLPPPLVARVDKKVASIHTD